jgi:hypothetical protein
VPPQGPITAAWHGGAALSKTSTFLQAQTARPLPRSVACAMLSTPLAMRQHALLPLWHGSLCW